MRKETEREEGPGAQTQDVRLSSRNLHLPQGKAATHHIPTPPEACRIGLRICKLWVPHALKCKPQKLPRQQNVLEKPRSPLALC